LLFDHKVRSLLHATDLRAYDLMTLQSLSRGPVHLATAETILASSAWAGLIARLTHPETANRQDGELLYATMLMPVTAMPRLLTAIEAVQTTGAREARAYADLVLAIPAKS
jgi:hypothetical protein